MVRAYSTRFNEKKTRAMRPNVAGKTFGLNPMEHDRRGAIYSKWAERG